MKRFLWTLAWTSVALAGSSNKPDVHLPGAFEAATPEAGIVAGKPIDAQWWKSFHDPELDDLISRAIRNNYDLRRAASRIVEARSNRAVSKSALLPTVNASTAANDLRGGFSQGVVHVGDAPGAPRGGSFVSPFETGLYQTGFDSHWEFDLFGRLRSNLNAATADLVASEESRHDVLITVAAETARNYLELRGTQRLLEITKQNIALQQDTLELTRVRAEAGLATQLDVERQAAQLATTEAGVPTLEAQELQAIHRLGVLLGDQPGLLLTQLRQAKPTPLTPPNVPIGLPLELLERRPDIRRAAAEIDAAAARAKSAKAELYPKIVWNGLSGRQATSISALSLGGGNFFSLGPSLQLPLFNGGQIRSEIKVQNARLNEALTAYEQSAATAMEEAENALVVYDREQKRRERLKAAVGASEQSVAMAQELYQHGLGDFLSVLDAQQAKLAADRSLVESDTTVGTNLVRLFKALGGGWQTAP